jgi:hypothetical protein
LTAALCVAVFAAVVAVDRLTKDWALRSLPAGYPGMGKASWSRSAPPLGALGPRGAITAWLGVGALGAVAWADLGGGLAAALGGVAAWAAAASNLDEWRRRGAVVDWVRLWPRSTTNLADATLIAGAGVFALGLAAS